MAKGNCEFRGTGGDYFSTVFIHLFLVNMLTFGIYTAWAWVKLIKLKASHTTVDGKAVTFNGTGGELFLLGLTQGLLTVLTFGIYGPWAICKIFNWRAQHTLVGRKSSQFTGTGGSLFFFYLVHLMILPMATLALYYFWGIYRLYAWKEEHTRYGGEKTSFGAGFGEFAKISFISWILNSISLNLFTPWSICMFYKWQVQGLAVGEEPKVKHFPPVKTNLAVVAALIVIGLLPVLGLGLFVKGQYERFMKGPAGLASVMKTQTKFPEGGTLKVSFPSTSPQISLKTDKTMGNPLTKTPPAKTMDVEANLRRLDNLIRRDGKNADAFFDRACLYASKGNLPRAEEDYARIIQLDNRDRTAYYNRGLVYVGMGKYDLALKDFTAALKLDPQAVDAYCNRGNVYYKLGNFDLAIQNYDKALGINPDDGDLYYNRAVVFLSRGKKGKAEEDLKRAAQLGQKRAQKYLRSASSESGTEDASLKEPSLVEWKMDVEGMEIPDTAGRGKIHGEVFTVEKAHLENGILTLREGKDFFADRELVIFLFLHQKDSPEGKSYRISKESGFGSPHIHMKWKERGKDLPDTQVFMKNYAMLLNFGQREGNTLPGKIYVCLPDENKSFVAGTFLAEVK